MTETIGSIKQGIEFIIQEDVKSEKHGNNVFWEQGDFFFNNQKRQATVTDVKYVAANLLIVAHRAAAKLYLVELKDQSFSIIDTLLLDTAKYSLNPKKRYGYRRFFHPDLIALHDNTVYISEYTKRCCIVEVIGNRLVYKKTIDLGNTPFHGCFSDNTHAMFGSVKDGCITTLNHHNHKVDKINAHLEPKQRIKTIGVEDDFWVLSIDKLSGKHTEIGSTADCWVKLYRRDKNNLEVLDTLSLPYGQIDGHKFYNHHHFITMHDGNNQCGVIMILKIIANKLSIVKRVACESFPHGIDIMNEQLIYTSYANSSIILHSLNELIET